MEASEGWEASEESGAWEESEGSEAWAGSEAWESQEAWGVLEVLEALEVPEESAVLEASEVQEGSVVPAAVFRTGSTARSIEGALRTPIARLRTDLVATREVLLSHRAPPVHGSRSAVRAGTCRAAVLQQAASVIVVAPGADSAAARGPLAAERIASAVVTYPAADRAQAGGATLSRHRAGTTDRARAPRAVAAHRAPGGSGAVAAAGAAVAEDADRQRQRRLIGARA